MNYKYWGIWNKKEKMWWFLPTYKSQSQSSLDIWKHKMGITKMINNIPIWNHWGSPKTIKDLWKNDEYEIKLFTPADALLAKCRKI